MLPSAGSQGKPTGIAGQSLGLPWALPFTPRLPKRAGSTGRGRGSPPPLAPREEGKPGGWGGTPQTQTRRTYPPKLTPPRQPNPIAPHLPTTKEPRWVPVHQPPSPPWGQRAGGISGQAPGPPEGGAEASQQRHRVPAGGGPGEDRQETPASGGLRGAAPAGHPPGTSKDQLVPRGGPGGKARPSLGTSRVQPGPKACEAASRPCGRS